MNRKKILLVDDSATTLMMEQMVLRGQAYQIVTAKNGREAVTTGAIEKPDLILLDVVMPEMNGFEACRLIVGPECRLNVLDRILEVENVGVFLARARAVKT